MRLCPTYTGMIPIMYKTACIVAVSESTAIGLMTWKLLASFPCRLNADSAIAFTLHL